MNVKSSFHTLYLPTLAGLGLGPVLVTSGSFGRPVLVLSDWLSTPIFDDWCRLLGWLIIPLLLGGVLFLAVVHGDFLSGVVGGLLLLVLLLANFFEVSVEEEIRHNAPLFGAADRSAEALDLSSQKPIHKTDAVWRAVVAWDDDVDVLQRAVRVAEGNNRDVNVTGLTDGLVINQRIRHENQSWLAEAGLRVIRERTWTEAAVVARGLDELGALDTSALAHVLAANDAYILRVVNGRDHSCGKLNFFPKFLHIKHVRTTGGSLEHVLVHLVVAVGVAEVGLGGQNFSGVRRL
jgi:hypothetical protein